MITKKKVALEMRPNVNILGDLKLLRIDRNQNGGAHEQLSLQSMVSLET